MAKTLEEYLQENPNLKIGDADMALGRDHFGALERIIQERKNWANATTQEEKDAAHNRAENIRKFYGDYSGGVDGMEGEYSPTYHRPQRAANNDNVNALFDKYNNAYKNPAPTWTPRYEQEISSILADLGSRERFSYDVNNDKLYQQYRDQYIREGQRAMKDTAAQTAALTGGYGSTYGAIAAQQGYDNYLERLNDRVPELEQQAYGRYADELSDQYRRLAAYQGEENRLYGQYMDALGQYNTDRAFTYNALQDAVGQNNYENQFERGIFESDRGYGVTKQQLDMQRQAAELQKRQADIDNALAIGDYSALRELGYDTAYLDFLQGLNRAQGEATLAKLSGAVSGGGSSGGSGTRSSGGSKKTKSGKKDVDVATKGESTEDGTKKVLAAYLAFGGDKGLDNGYGFDNAVKTMLEKKKITDADYEKFRAAVENMQKKKK